MPDVAGSIPTVVGDAVPAGVGHQHRRVHRAARSAPGVWIEFERGDPDYPIWVGGYWGTAAEVPVLAQTVPPAVNGITLQTTLKNGIVVSDVPGPDRRHPDPDDDRRDDLGQRRRHHHLATARAR